MAQAFPGKEKSVVFGVFTDLVDLKYAFSVLRERGFRASDLTMHVPLHLSRSEDSETRLLEDTVNGLTGVFGEFGVPEYEAEKSQLHIEENGLTLFVLVGDEEQKERACEVLESCEAVVIGPEPMRRPPNLNPPPAYYPYL